MKKLSTTVLAPITDAGKIVVPEGTNHLMLQNAGTSTAIYNKGWTMLPGGNLSIGSQTDENILVVDFTLEFEPLPGTVNRIEWITQKLIAC